MYDKVRVSKHILSCLAFVILAGCGAGGLAPPLGGEKSGTIQIQSLTLPPSQPFTTNKDAAPVTLSGELSFPAQSEDRVPAVILAHGCGGVGAVIRGWVSVLNRTGIATLVLDSFAGREIRETCTGRERINLGSRIIDAYRALELLAGHPRIDPARIALMGFSQGGGVVLLARHTRFHKLWMTAKRDFAAYLAFYPGCSRKLTDEEQVSERPFRMFHGAADDWTPIQPCREYNERMRRLGKDVALFEYAEAHHGFDNPNVPAPRFRSQVLNGSNCVSIEQPDGRFRTFRRDNGRRSTRDDPCLRRGATIGYNEAAYHKAVQDVKDFLSATLKPGGA